MKAYTQTDRMRGIWRVLVGLALCGSVRAETPVLQFTEDTVITLDGMLDTGADMTLEYWFKTDWAESWQLFNNSSTDKSNFEHADASTIRFWWWPNAWMPLTQTFGTNVWEHFALVRSGYDVRVYRNGNLVGERGSNHPLAFNRIGGISAYTSHGSIPPGIPFEGQAAEIRVWDHPRTQAQIAALHQRRLRGNEPGLRAYWRLDGREGAAVHNLAANQFDGTATDPVWTTSANLVLDDPLSQTPGPVAFRAFTLADIDTGSTRFTNSNEVDIAAFPIPAGYNRFQITTSNTIASLSETWRETTSPPTRETILPPAGAGEATLYAWFTNSTDAVTLRVSGGSIIYTTASPTPVVRPALSRRTGGFTVRVTGENLDAGSTGGLYDGEPIGIHRLEAIRTGGDAADLTPTEPFVTLPGANGAYTLRLRVIDEAGNVAESAVDCAVSVTSVANLPVGDRYVALGNLNASGDHDTWASAAPTIQAAIDEAQAGDRILIAPGRYVAANPAAQRVADSTIALHLIGVGSNREAVIVDGEGQRGGIRFNQPAAPVDVRIENLSVVNGNTTAFSGWDRHGAGIWLRHSAADGGTAVVHNVAIEANIGSGLGGGLAVWGKSGGSNVAHITQCTFIGNRSATGNRGGGAATTLTRLFVEDSEFRDNWGGTSGGGGLHVHTAEAESSIRRTDFIGNRLADFGNGGGLNVDGASTDLLIDRCRFEGNIAGDGASRSGSGGGLRAQDGTLTLRNILFSDNYGASGGAGPYVWDANVLMENCTVVTNWAYGAEGGSQGLGAGASGANRGDFIVRNSIVYHNVRLGMSGHENLRNSTATFTCNTPLLSGEGNFSTEPKFVDFVGGDFRLSKDSPCVDAGTNQVWMVGARDLDGGPRIDFVSGRVDVGCYELQPAGTLILIR